MPTSSTTMRSLDPLFAPASAVRWAPASSPRAGQRPGGGETVEGFQATGMPTANL